MISRMRYLRELRDVWNSVPKGQLLEGENWRPNVPRFEHPVKRLKRVYIVNQGFREAA
tara:strand:- start:586 stop:759 length:174 start_codon:yes stop_codon:yes gene_type:complete